MEGKKQQWQWRHWEQEEYSRVCVLRHPTKVLKSSKVFTIVNCREMTVVNIEVYYSVCQLILQNTTVYISKLKRITVISKLQYFLMWIFKPASSYSLKSANQISASWSEKSLSVCRWTVCKRLNITIISTDLLMKQSLTVFDTACVLRRLGGPVGGHVYCVLCSVCPLWTPSVARFMCSCVLDGTQSFFYF